jgi:hypothetical protein
MLDRERQGAGRNRNVLVAVHEDVLGRYRILRWAPDGAAEAFGGYSAALRLAAGLRTSAA